MRLPKLTMLFPFMILLSSWRGYGASDAGFVPIFDGTTLHGWHASAETGHSSVSKHKSGGKWLVQTNAIIGSQDVPGNGGILITDKQFGDFEIVLEIGADFPLTLSACLGPRSKRDRDLRLRAKNLTVNTKRVNKER